MENFIINKFNEIRDIPYKIPLKLDGNYNNCFGKTMKLKSLFDSHGYKSKFRVVDYLWSDLDLPSELLSIPHENGGGHVYLELFLDGKWVNLDPTWDSGLKNIFSISIWDGKSDTILAVNPINIYDDESSENIMSNIDEKEFEKDIDMNGQFYEAFNKWLENNRI